MAEDGLGASSAFSTARPGIFDPLLHTVEITTEVPQKTKITFLVQSYSTFPGHILQRM
jgi:hypothetical protein